MAWGASYKAITGVRAGVLVCLIGIALLRFVRSTDILLLGTVDFLQYWSAAELFWHRESNPYDITLLTRLQESVTSFRPLPVVMWNPPLILPLLLPLLFAPFSYVHVAWMLCSIVVYLRGIFCLRAMLVKSPSDARYSLYLSAFAVAFYPFILTLSYGQISIFLLGSLIGFFVFAQSQSNRDCVMSGIILSVTLCKPHLLVLCYVALFVRAIRQRRERLMVLGLLIGVCCLTGITLSANMSIWSYYWQAIKAPPYQWLTPTLGAWFQFLLKNHPSWSRYLPLVCAIPVVAVLSLFEKGKTEILILRIVPFSLFLAPYGWVYDQILLLPTLTVEVMAILGSGKVLLFRSYVLLSLLFLVVESYYLLLGVTRQEYFVFVPLCCGIILWCLRRLQRLT
jgi:Glycosyltransferase family 87